MSVYSLRYIDDPVLRQVAEPISTEDLGRDMYRVLVEDMITIMREHGGVGLAAPQVGMQLRVFVYEIDDEVGHVINPTWEAVGTQTQTGEEGCLSIPGIRGEVERAETVRLRGVTLDGSPVDREVSGLFARCVQHEVDHLDGVLFLERLSREDRKAAMRAIRQGLAGTAGSGVAGLA